MTAKSWKTSLFGLIGAAAVVMSENPELVNHNVTLLLISKLTLAGAFAGLGIVSRDERVSDEQAEAGVKPKPDPVPVVIVEKSKDETAEKGKNDQIG